MHKQLLMLEDMSKNAVFFDMDGVLVNTEPLKQAAHVAATKALGGDLPSGFYERLLGMSQSVVAAAAIREAGITVSTEQYNEEFVRFYFHSLNGEVTLMPGAAELLDALRARSCHIALVSSSPRLWLDSILTRLGLAACFEATVSANDITNHKPAPDPYLKALSLVKILPRHALALEDTDSGIMAATSAELRTIACRHALNSSQSFARAYLEVTFPLNAPQMISSMNEIFLHNEDEITS